MDIDTLSVELSREIALESIEKALPPKLLYRFRRWLNRMKTSPGISNLPIGKFEQAIYEKFIEIQGAQSLAKNEAMASFYDNGIVKMDFGSEVSPKIKDAAMKWAKKKGLQVIEASINKSAAAVQSYTLSGGGTLQDGICMKRIKWAS